MKKILTKRQKEIELLRATNKMLSGDFKAKVSNAVRNAVNDNTRPISDLQIGDETILNEVSDKFNLK